MRVLRHFALHPAEGEARGVCLCREGRACAVYSASLHPDGTILATCGADKKVRLWKTSLLFQETLDAETQSAQTESLATVSDGALAAELSSHTQGVNCVRWNHGGEYLASSSDDTLIFLWEHKEGAGRGGGKWVRAATLRGHAMDVLDLAWGANDGLLASCSIDNRVIVWNTQNVSPLLPPLKVLCGHTNWVKGVAWDPLGRFLASASEDRSVVVWRATDWAIEAKITLPFAGVTAQTFFQRLSRGAASVAQRWSPDGAALGLPNAAKAQQQIAAVVSRNAWDAAAADLVGHKQPVTVVKFAPVLFRAAATIQCPEPQPHSVVAIGSQDATALAGAGHFGKQEVSIWTDAAARPLLVLRDCCAGAVSDLCWAADGSALVATSHDGSMCTLIFAPDDGMGAAVHPLQRPKQSPSLASPPPAPSPAAPSPAAPSPAAAAGPAEPQQAGAREPFVQHKCSFQDGKKRIRPTLITSAGDSRPLAAFQGDARPSAAVAAPAAAPARARADALPAPAALDVLSCHNTGDAAATLHLQSVVRQGGAIVGGRRISASVLTASRRGAAVWKSEVRGRAAALVGAGGWVAVGTHEGFLYVLDAHSGAVLTPALQLGTACCHMRISSSKLAVLTRDAELRVFELEDMALEVSVSVLPALWSALRLDAAPLPDAALPNIVEIALDASCATLVLDVDGEVQVFTLDTALRCWSRCGDAGFSHAMFAAARASASGNALGNALQHLEVDENAAATSAHLEERVAGALSAKAWPELEHWLSVYVRYILASDDILRLRTLLTRLQKQSHAKVRALLANALALVCEHDTLQHVAHEIAESLEAAEP